MYHVCREGSMSGESFDSLDRALVGAIDQRKNGIGARAAYYAFKVLDI